MPVVVLPALIPDIEEVYDIYFAAFKNEPMGEIMLGILFPGGITEEFRKSHAAATLDWWHKSTTQYTFKVVEVETREIIGMILADVYWKERSEQERQWTGIPWLQGAEKERAEAITRPLWEVREKLFGGRRYVYVHAIAIKPEKQGLKAGMALIQWGIDMADRGEVPIYIESSPSTWKLYERVGFERIEEKIVHKKELTHAKEDIDVPLMVRMPTVAKGMTFDEWRAKGYPPFEQ
ncbi:uncharacterized protein Z518_02450 [Rhinocladiella mackenziei CBS 650.93]|uniref:N-acetyltransferase domain-containing protein n=1 Tax=Rhinocladiella mackenziei CBS 650.93 TaxID=1442369 RepID=A0A0D2IWN7_9EURO|nr:uncharacterized protein Z518_02450 [Rhinocladiella mackenziei CBS 650.93]KIX07796.1 hypothetical protein Z518_02450 [Rhinocladiella mackenziei CBS 650.93]